MGRSAIVTGGVIGTGAATCGVLSKMGYRTKVVDGSWWPAWLSWLDDQTHGLTPPPSVGAPEIGYPPLEDALGLYVFQR